jgi:predicted transcriptional regulator
MSGKGRFPQQLTPLELQIMNVLWDCGPSNVQSVQEKLTASPTCETRRDGKLEPQS